MWRECNGAPFEVPPFQLWPDMVRTLSFIRDHVRPARGRSRRCRAIATPRSTPARAAPGAARTSIIIALDLIPVAALTRRQLFERLCPMHRQAGPAANAGLGFYSFTRFHIDTRSFRRYGSAGPAGNESPCAVLERGEDPEAPPLPVVPVTMPPIAEQPTQPQPQPQ